jgi:hypothetical protein
MNTSSPNVTLIINRFQSRISRWCASSYAGKQLRKQSKHSKLRPRQRQRLKKRRRQKRARNSDNDMIMAIF